MGVSKRIFGGSSGYSGGNVSRARKKPPIILVRHVHCPPSNVRTSIEFGVIINHEHHLPLEDIAVD
jgi:hypothetical protein